MKEELVEITNNVGKKEMVSKKFAETWLRIKKEQSERYPIKKDKNGLPAVEEIPIDEFADDYTEEELNYVKYGRSEEVKKSQNNDEIYKQWL